MLFWDMTLWGLVDVYRRFGWPCYLRLQCTCIRVCWVWTMWYGYTKKGVRGTEPSDRSKNGASIWCPSNGRFQEWRDLEKYWLIEPARGVEETGERFPPKYRRISIRLHGVITEYNASWVYFLLLFVLCYFLQPLVLVSLLILGVIASICDKLRFDVTSHAL
jgi:hypothetical protein